MSSIFNNHVRWYNSLELCIDSGLAQINTFVVYKVPKFSQYCRETSRYYWVDEPYANSHDDLPGKYYCTVTNTPR